MTDTPPTFVHDHNRQAWDARVRGRQVFTRPARDADFAQPLAVVDRHGWLGPSIAGKRVLCLAAGGGSQSALYAAAGAKVTVVDISGEMLALDRQVAAERQLDVTCIQASMDDLAGIGASGFDIVIQPVSTCYVPDVARAFREVARVTTPGGLYISQHKQPASLQAATEPTAAGYPLVEPYYRTGPLPEVVGSPHREPGTLEFLHRWEELIGGMCRAGFSIEDLVEPLHAEADAAIGTFGHRSRYVPPYVRIKARRSAAAADGAGSSRVWIPS
ncbi:MAG TPA: class I SAM-dependent methyltransferase [Pirellulales bacterium]|nr:class I SAM-dependent methyltransferase [Pirellulales bacterium]